LKICGSTGSQCNKSIKGISEEHAGTNRTFMLYFLSRYSDWYNTYKFCSRTHGYCTGEHYRWHSTTGWIL